jgi:hypothetical protein
MEEGGNVQTDEANGRVFRSSVKILLGAMVIHLAEEAWDGIDLVIVVVIV